MGDEHRGRAHFIVQPAQPAPQLLPHLGVERAERLVEQQHLRLHRERAREGNALALSARKLVGVALGEPLELHQLEQRPHLLADARLREACLSRANAQAEGHILENAHVAEKRVVLEHEPHAPLAHVRIGGVLAMEQHLPRVRPLEARDDPQQRGFARARWPEQREQLARSDLEAHLVERDEAAEALGQVLQRNAHPMASVWRRWRHSASDFAASVTSASSVRSDATANAPAN